MTLTADEIKTLIRGIRSLPLPGRVVFIGGYNFNEKLSILRGLTGEEQQEIIGLLPESLETKLREALIDELEIPPELLDGILRGIVCSSSELVYPLKPACHPRSNWFATLNLIRPIIP